MATRGVLRPISSIADFIALFGEDKVSRIVAVDSGSLALHTIGDKIDVSSYERDSGNSTVVGQKIATDPPEYKALWLGADAPSMLIAGQTDTIKVRFKNKSNVSWGKGDVYALISETGGKTENNDPVPVGNEYEVKLPITPSSAGIAVFTVTVYTKDGAAIKGALYQAKVRVKDPTYSANILSHTLPIAVRASWVSVKVKVRVKNVGKESWTRKKTGLRFLKEDGSAVSPFYDASDWVDESTASVSLEPRKDIILPGEEAVFAFTLKTRGLATGLYRYRLALWMSDKNTGVLVNGKDFYEAVVRVDK